MTAGATLRVEDVSDVRVVSLHGELDVASAGALEPDALRAVRGAVRVALDLGAVTFVDSAGVRLLDHLVAAVLPMPLRVVVVAGSPVAFTLRLCGFREDLLAADLPSALTAVRTG